MIRETSKAIAGAIVAAATATAACLSDGDLSVVDGCAIAGAAAAGYLGVWVAPRNVDDVQRARIRRRRRGRL